MLPSPDSKFGIIGSVGQEIFFFFFFFFYVPWESWVIRNIFLKVSKWGKLGQNAVKRAYTSHLQVLF